jgi:hypothetical protein
LMRQQVFRKTLQEIVPAALGLEFDRNTESHQWEELTLVGGKVD